MTTYKCKCGRQVAKRTNADNTGNRDTTGCEGCPYLLPWGPSAWDDTRHAVVTDVKGYECRMSPELSYITELWGRVDDKCTMQINSLDFDFLERVSAWIKEHYPNSELSGGFSRAKMRACEFVTHGRYRMSICCAQNKAGMAAKAALVAAFFDPKSKTRLDIDPAAEKQLILNAIEAGKEAARQDVPKKEIINMDVAYKGPDGRLYRVSAQSDAKGGYYIEYRDPVSSAVYKPLPGYHHNANRDNVVDQLAGLIKELGLQAVMLEEPAASPASAEPSEIVDESSEPPSVEPAALTAPPAADIAAPGFDYAGLAAQTVAILQSAEDMIRGARKEYVIKVADAVGVAHDEFVRNSDKRNNQYSEDTFCAWCTFVGLSRATAYQLLQVSDLLSSSTPNEQKVLEQASPSLLYAAAKPSAPAELVEGVKTGDITTHKQYKELLAQLKATEQAKAEAERRAHNLENQNQSLLHSYESEKGKTEKAEREKREALAWKQHAEGQAEDAKAAIHDAQQTAQEAQRAAETLKQQIYRRNEELAEKEQALNTVLDQQGEYIAKIRELEKRPKDVDVVVQQPSEADIERWRKEGEERARAALAGQAPTVEELTNLANGYAAQIDGMRAVLAQLSRGMERQAVTHAADKLCLAADQLHDLIMYGPEAYGHG